MIKVIILIQRLKINYNFKKQQEIYQRTHNNNSNKY